MYHGDDRVFNGRDTMPDANSDDDVESYRQISSRASNEKSSAKNLTSLQVSWDNHARTGHKKTLIDKEDNYGNTGTKSVKNKKKAPKEQPSAAEQAAATEAAIEVFKKVNGSR